MQIAKLEVNTFFTTAPQRNGELHCPKCQNELKVAWGTNAEEIWACFKCGYKEVHN